MFRETFCLVMFLFKKILPVLHLLIRPFIKWFLHTFTRLCELQRICYGAKAGANRTKQVERSLTMSHNRRIQELIKDLNQHVEHCDDNEFIGFSGRAVGIVMREKCIKPHCHPDFPALFGQCVTQIWGYKRLMIAVEKLRSEPYDAANIVHERKLLELWNELMPDTPLETRITKQWQEIGFQGDDPKTDFRGMGMLGLENLLYFVKEYRDAARHVLSHSMHPRFGYTFAIVGINITSMAFRMVKEGSAKTQFFNICKTAPNVDHFHMFYSFLFYQFDSFWMESEPRNIMDFSTIYKNFEEWVLHALKNDDTVFNSNPLIEII
ncbi:ELMO domain-containing protein 2 [Episyrphus balteatus]|uniref:ELMO domain-containing protein 2 n=1 Tax=Episyrphus balteatus TaxID=286459 RepID=UPI002486758F|nr:ELMO domain-containing protein 2 [Episyrphus balteatus]XP_055849774.1 ELMO domain-containing protein 2 [Episyrphus balteatus]